MTVVSGPVVDTSGRGLDGALWARTGRPATSPYPDLPSQRDITPTKGDTP